MNKPSTLIIIALSLAIVACTGGSGAGNASGSTSGENAAGTNMSATATGGRATSPPDAVHAEADFGRKYSAAQIDDLARAAMDSTYGATGAQKK